MTSLKIFSLAATLLLAAASFSAQAQNDSATTPGAGFRISAGKLFKSNNGGLYDPYAAADTFSHVVPSGQFKIMPSKRKNAHTWRIIAGCSAMFIAGGANGLNETISNNYGAFKKHVPNANDMFWDGKISWKNKYAGANPENGPKFKGSTGMLVWTTDGYHLTNTIRTTFFVGGSITIGAGPKRPTWQRIAEAGAGLLSYWVGNYVMTDMVFKQ